MLGLADVCFERHRPVEAVRQRAAERAIAGGVVAPRQTDTASGVIGASITIRPETTTVFVPTKAPTCPVVVVPVETVETDICLACPDTSVVPPEV